MPRVRIVADRSVSFLRDAFGHLGEITALPAGSIDSGGGGGGGGGGAGAGARDAAAAVRDADLLIIRSTVRVDEALLAGSRVRFVGSAVAGREHLDVPWLEEHGIAWASAPGCNAGSVAQWFASALLETARRRHRELRGLTVGLVGVGAVGSRVERLCVALGCRVLRNDPPRARAEGEDGFVALDELCAESDVVTLHVPLTAAGPDRTRCLFDAARLATLRPGAWLVNSARGPVLDAAAAVTARSEGALGALLLDVYPDEPTPPPALVAAADLATPHIAGHSLDGKAAGTEAVYRAACAFLGVKPVWTARRSLPPPPTAAIALDTRRLDDEAAALAVLRRCYRIEDDEAALRRIAALPATERGRAFQEYRDGYPHRREPIGLRVQMRPPRPRALKLLEALGAVVQES